MGASKQIWMTDQAERDLELLMRQWGLESRSATIARALAAATNVRAESEHSPRPEESRT